MKFQYCLLGLCVAALSAVSLAKDNPQQYFKFFDDGGEHPLDTCQTTKKLPKKLKKMNGIEKIVSKQSQYLGAHQVEFAAKNEAGIDAYEHYFTNKHDCMNALKTLQKEYNM